MTDKYTAFVRAAGETEARQAVADDTENDDWIDPTKAKCDRIFADGETSVIAWFDDDKMAI